MRIIGEKFSSQAEAFKAEPGRLICCQKGGGEFWALEPAELARLSRAGERLSICPAPGSSLAHSQKSPGRFSWEGSAAAG